MSAVPPRSGNSRAAVMTLAAGQHETGASLLRDLGIWSLAAVIVLGLHGGGLAWYLRERPIPVSDGGPPPAIMIELAPMPEASETDQTELSPDQQDSQQSAAVEEVKSPEPEPEPLPQEEPVEDLPEPDEITEPKEPLPEEIPQEAEVALPMQSSPRPEPRPERREEPKPVRERPREQPKPQPQEASAASEATTRARNADAQKSSRDAASQSATGSGRSMSPARWQSRLMAHLERHKPRARGERGTAYVRFRIDANGRVLSANLARSSGSSGIDEAAVATVRNASPVPAPPPGVNLSMTVAIEFKR